MADIRIDSNRDKILNEFDTGKYSWFFGNSQRGAIAMVSNIKGKHTQNPDFGKWKKHYCEIQVMNISSTSNDLRFQISKQEARIIRLWGRKKNGDYKIVLGKKNKGSLRKLSPNLINYEKQFYLEALEFPNRFFEGFIHLLLGDYIHKIKEFATLDEALLRVAPLILLPSTNDPIEIFVCRAKNNENDKFISDLKNLVNTLGYPLTELPSKNQDIWIQDQVEFAYTEGVNSSLEVAFESPRKNGLSDVVEKHILNDEQAHLYIKRKVNTIDGNSLDSFGNLEVMPIKQFPFEFGRILIGGRKKNQFNASRNYPYRSMSIELRSFLFAQKIQAPIEIYTDWLDVGHVDEIFTFIPDFGSKNPLGFIMMVANTELAFHLLSCIDSEKLSNQKKWKAIFENENLKKENIEYQTYINDNILLLNEEVGKKIPILEVPIIFSKSESRLDRAIPLMPNMVNNLVLKDKIIAPKPMGPEVHNGLGPGNKICIFENYMKEKLGSRILFIDDSSCFKGKGDVHCATNVRRKRFPNKWWESNFKTCRS